MRGVRYDHNLMRINKFLAACGLGSRRKVEEIVLARCVSVNGSVVTDLSTFIEPDRDRVMVDGRAARLPESHTYYLLHKPEGIMTTARDPEGRSTVQELVPARPRVFPVGRLDRDTSGALLMTDDGPLAHRILHPRYGVEKEYIAVVEGTITDDALGSLRAGVLLDGERRPTAPAMVDVLERKNKRSRIRLIVHEGRNRQVRRMLEAVGYLVLSLRRERVGPVKLGDLGSGLFRPLTAQEVAGLRRETARPRAVPRPRRVDVGVDARAEGRPRGPRIGKSRPSVAGRRSETPKPRQRGNAKHAVQRTRKAPGR